MLRLLFLGPLRARLGVDACDLPCPADGSQTALWSALRERFPQWPESAGAIRLARGDEFLAGEETLRPGDEIALIPPVSGG